MKNKQSSSGADVNSNNIKRSWISQLQRRIEYTIALKTGIGVCLSLYFGLGFAKLLNRPDSLLSGTWCVISTIIVMQAHLGGTYRAAWVRFLGVLIGSFMGGLFTSFFGSNAFTLGFSVVLTVWVCSLFRLKESIRIACLSLSIVMILWGLHPSISPWTFGLFRFLDSVVGIIVAVVVSHTLWPARATTKLRLNIAKTLHYINRLLQFELSLNPPPKHFDRIHRKLIRDINHLFIETRNFLKESELELLTKTRNLDDWTNIIDHMEEVFEATTALRTFHEYNIKTILDPKLLNRLNKSLEISVETFGMLINGLKSEQTTFEISQLRAAAFELNEELTRFRMTRTTRKFERQDVEHFFVFFYNLRTTMEELIKIEDKIRSLNSQPK